MDCYSLGLEEITNIVEIAITHNCESRQINFVLHSSSWVEAVWANEDAASKAANIQREDGRIVFYRFTDSLLEPGREHTQMPGTLWRNKSQNTFTATNPK